MDERDERTITITRFRTELAFLRSDAMHSGPAHEAEIAEIQEQLKKLQNEGHSR